MKHKAGSRSKAPRLDVLEGRLAPGDALLSQVLGLMVFGSPTVPQTPALLEPAVSSSLALSDSLSLASPLDLSIFSMTDLETVTPEAPGSAAPPVVASLGEAFLDSGFVSIFETAAPALRRPEQQANDADQELFRAANAIAVEPSLGASLPQGQADVNPALLAPRTDWSDYLTELTANVSPIELPQGRTNGGPNSAGVDVLLINFNGSANVNIRFNENLDFGDFGTGLGDLEWYRYVRDQPNTTEIWDSSQSAPAAFVKNAPLTADVLFYVDDPTIDALFVHAANAGAYSDVPLTYVAMQDGWGWATVSTVDIVSTVAVNDVTFSWTVDYTCRGEQCDYKDAWIVDSTHRIYTLQNRPVAGMAQPWATVLEVAAGMVSGLNTNLGIVQEMTRGIHHSTWRELRGSAHFIDPRAVFIYNPGRAVRSRILGPGPITSDRFITQDYNLAGFMSFLGVPELQQQCNDNSNLLNLWLAALGVPMTPPYFARSTSHSPTLNRTTYYPAGRTVTESYNFTFHQIGNFGGLVYDLSTRPAVVGNPNMDITFLDYLDRAFPGQRAVGYVTRNVTTINPGPGTGQTEFTLTGVGPNLGARGTTIPVVLSGAGFDAALTLRAVENSTTTTATGVTITNRRNISSNKIAFDLVIAANATPRTIQILGARASAPNWWPARANFVITA